MAKPNTRTYKVTFPSDALPGVRAVGPIKRGGSAEVDAAEALRLVRAKGLSFADAADKARAEADVKAAQAAAIPELPAADAPAAPTVTPSEEH